MKKFLGCTGVVLISLCWGSAFGQSYRNFDDELNQIRNTARLRFGPFRFIPDFRLVNVGYDDNVYFRSADNKPVGDYTGTASAEGRAYLLLGHSIILSFLENPEYLYFAKQVPLRRFTNSFSPGARLKLFNRFALSGSYHFQKHARRAYAEFASLVTDTNKGVELAGFYETPRGSALGFSRTVERFLYEDLILPDSEILFSRSLNRKETTGSFELYYPVFAESFFFLTAGATYYEFESPSARWKDSKSYQTSAGLRFPLMGRARGTLSVGYKKFRPNSKNRKAFSGLIADTKLDFRLGRFDVRFGLSRDNYFSYLEDVLDYINDSVSPGLSFRLTRRFRLDYDFEYEALKYPEPFLVTEPGGAPLEIVRRDIHRMHAIGFTIFFLRRTGIRLSYNIFERTSNAPGFGRKKNFIGVSLIRDF